MLQGKFIVIPLALTCAVLMSCIAQCRALKGTLNISSDEGLTTTAQYLSSTVNVTETGNKTSEDLLAKASRLLPFKIGMSLQTYYMAAIVPVGLVGNTLALVVLLQKRNRRVSCCVYMAALAFSDLVLMGIALYYWLITDVLTTGWTLWECKMMVWLFHSLTTNGTWMVVAMTVDRCIAVSLPLRTFSWCRPRRAYVTSAVIVTASALYCVPHVLYTTVLETKTSCAGFTSNNGLFGIVYSWASLVTGCLLPFSIILVLNIKIGLVVLKRGNIRKHAGRSNTTTEGSHSLEIPPENPAMSLSSISEVQVDISNSETGLSDQHDSAHVAVDQSTSVKTSTMSLSELADNTAAKPDSREHQLIVNLFLVTLALLILTLPQYVRYTVYEFLPFRDNPDSFADYVLAFHITQKLYYTNSAINFFLYCLSGSRFRRDLKDTLACCKRCK